MYGTHAERPLRLTLDHAREGDPEPRSGRSPQPSNPDFSVAAGPSESVSTSCPRSHAISTRSPPSAPSASRMTTFSSLPYRPTQSRQVRRAVVPSAHSP
ncbi:hypothetical protein O1M54_49065 [Streptomyces diastatochromogenes]|nr:hypothetical protein [Streptomyces diastatochromogenes]